MADVQSAAGLRRGGEKIQTEDDISASVVVTRRALARRRRPNRCRTFKRAPATSSSEMRIPPLPAPDEAIHRGMDKQTETDLARRRQFHLQF